MKNWIIIPNDIEFFGLDLTRSAHQISSTTFEQCLEYFAVCIMSTKNLNGGNVLGWRKYWIHNLHSFKPSDQNSETQKLKMLFGTCDNLRIDSSKYDGGCFSQLAEVEALK